jgi:outer membrane protein TolC
MSAIQLGLMQPLPYPGKLAARRDAARAMARVADRQVRVLASKIALDVRHAYWRLSFAEAALRTSEQSERVLNTLTDVVHIRFSVAQAAQQDALQAQTAHSRLRAEVRRRRQLVVTARRTLNGAVGRRPNADAGRVAEPPVTTRPLDREALMTRLYRSNPSLAVGRAHVHSAASAVDAAEQERSPDFVAGFAYRFRMASPGDMSEGADMFGVTLGVTLPVWMSWKQNAGVREANARRRAAAEHVSSIDLAASTALEGAMDEVQRLDEEIALYEKEVLPEADAALDASIEDYAFARVGFVSLLQNWQMDLDAKLMLQRLRTDRAQRLADIDALVGAVIPGEK